MITYKDSKIAAAEISLYFGRDNLGELDLNSSYGRLLSNRYLGEDGVLSLGDTYLNFSEVPIEVIGQLDAALVALYECLPHLQKLKDKPQLSSADLKKDGVTVTF